MAGKKKQLKQPETPGAGMLMQTLLSALKEQEDFIVTLETDDTGKEVLHVMTGKLITPCMLGTLTNRCEYQERDGSRHTILKKARPKKIRKT